MKTITLEHIAAAFLLSCTLAGCASSGGTAASAFPTGSYARGDTVVRMNPDGTWVGTTRSGEDWARGTYTIAGDTLTVTDSWYSSAQMQPCIGVPGKYRWSQADGVLRFQPIADACQSRVEGVGTEPWPRID